MNTAQSNGAWRTHVHTLKGWEGSLSCYWDETDTNGQETLDAGSSIDIKVYPEGADTGDTYFSGTAIVTGISRKATLDGMVEATFSFKGTGALTQATAS
jgi:predicted secreted protein